MKTVKFAAHYMLTPENGLQQWPLLTLDQDGCLLSWEVFPEGLREQPFVQFFSGILIPAFIDVVGVSPMNKSLALPVSFDRHFARGTLVLGIEQPDEVVLKRQSPPFIVRGRVTQEAFEDPWMIPSQEDLPIWERMKKWALRNEKHNLEQMLVKATTEGARMGKISYAGALVPQSYPGVLLLQNVDLQAMKLTADSIVRWLSVPERTI